MATRTFVEETNVEEREISPLSDWRVRLRLGVGGVVVLLLLLGSVLAFFANDYLEQTEELRHRRFLPPQWVVFQRLFFQPLTTKTERIVVQVAADSFSEFEDSAPAVEGTPVEVPFAIASVPIYSVVLGDDYRYEVELEGPSEGIQFRLGQSPEGMHIDPSTGEVTWTPEAEDWRGSRRINKIRVGVQAVDAQGYGVQQSFDLFVVGSSYPLGTDKKGRSLFSALILGAKWALLPGLIAVVVSMVLGVWMGGVAGYFGGRIDDALTYVARLVEAFPALVLIFLAAAIFNFNIYLVMVAVGVIWFPSVANAIRAKVLFFKAQQFIEASQELGLEDRQILWWDIVWHNVKPLLFTQISYGFARAILIEVTLSYLKMGVVEASWGRMLLEGREAMLNHGASWVIFFPALAIVVAVVGFYLVGDAANRMYQIKSIR